MSSPGLQPRPRAEVEAWLKEMAERYEHTTDKLVKQWVESEMELRGFKCSRVIGRANGADSVAPKHVS